MICEIELAKSLPPGRIRRLTRKIFLLYENTPVDQAMRAAEAVTIGEGPMPVNEHNAKLETPLQRHREEAQISSQNRDTLTENL